MSAPCGARALLRFAHRGASARAPENTLAAFEEAIRLGVEAIEMDVRLTKDGVPVVIHDDTLDRTTDGRGAVAARTLQEIRALDAGGWFSPRFRRERVPSLAEALECARGRCGLNLELKTPRRPARRGGRGGPSAGAALADLAGAVARAIDRARFGDLLILSSFAPACLIAARAGMPRARLAILLSRSARGVAPLHRRVGLWGTHPHLRLATPRRIAAAHALGLRVCVWPVNQAADLSRLAALGVDGLMSDDPSLFHALAPPAPAPRPVLTKDPAM